MRSRSSSDIRNDPFLPRTGALEQRTRSRLQSKRALARVASSHAVGDSPGCAARLAVLSALVALTVALVVAPVALGHDGGEGTYGETNDKVVTNAGLHPHRLLPAVRPRDVDGPDGARPPQGPPQGRAEGARTRGPRARRLVARSGRGRRRPVRYERVGAAAVLTIDRPARRNAIDGPTAEALAAALRRVRRRRRRARARPHRRGRRAPSAPARTSRRSRRSRRASTTPAVRSGFTRAHPGEADDRRDRGLVPGGRPRARAVVRPADRDRGLRGSASPSGASACRSSTAARSACRGSSGSAAPSTSS